MYSTCSQNYLSTPSLPAIGSTAIAYDAIGNPTTYNGYSLTWDGRQLKKMGRNAYVLEFLYNADGIRTSKTVNGVEHVYTLNGSQIVSEAWSGTLFVYLYDESGSPIGIQYRYDSYAAGTFNTFYFEKNLQGDIVAIYTESGEKVLSYTYDAWGNHTTTWHNTSGANLLALYNPFRYRGYYYDIETGLYYLQSRYYNPAWGRFLNADGYVNANGDLIGFNMYAYCGNNPVNGYDPTGKWTFSLSLAFSMVLPGAGYSFSIGISFDSEDMCAIQYSYSVPKDNKTRYTALGAGVGGGVSFQYTDYDSVDDLTGSFKYAGINTSKIGVNGVYSEENELRGVEASLGPAIGGDLHVNETHTEPLVKFGSFIKFIKDLTGWWQ